MDWVIFGDDWGAHPSTTQHLVRHLPQGDRVVWVNSIGMRRPRLARSDLRRIVGRLRAMLRRGRRAGSGTVPAGGGRGRGPEVHVIEPRVLPWHDRPLAVAAGRRALSHAIERVCGPKPAVLLSNPVAIRYLRGLPHGRVGYLRLDDYARLPGVDADLVVATEREVFEEADLVFATARALLPDQSRLRGTATYLPQGVDTEHFASAPLEPPGSRVLGFFGLIAEWIDLSLVCEVARQNPTWTLEMIGPVRCDTRVIDGFDNVRLLPGVPYEQLPAAISGWAAAWIPFVRSQLTDGVNPLKLREYLAAGLPTASTPLPEVRTFAGSVALVDDAEAVSQWLCGAVADDDRSRREARRASVVEHSWSVRARQLRAAFETRP